MGSAGDAPDPSPYALQAKLFSEGLKEVSGHLAEANRLLQEAGRERLPPAAGEALNGVLKRVLESRGTLARLSGLLVPPPLELRGVPFREVVEEVQRRVKETGGQPLAVEIRPAGELPRVLADPRVLAEALADVARLAGPGQGVVLEWQKDRSSLRWSAPWPAGSVDAPTSSGGSGLVLAAMVLEGHGGRLQVERLGGGMMVHAWLPVAETPGPVGGNTLLLADDRMEGNGALVRFLEAEGYRPKVVGDADAFKEALQRDAPELILLPTKWVEREGMELLKEIRASDVTLPVLLLGGGEGEPAVSAALARGVAGVLWRPLKKEQVLAAVKKALEDRVLRLEVEQLRERLALPAEGGIVFGESESTRKVLGMVRQVAPTDMTIIIQGESGVGKEVIARLIHRYSRRVNRPFIAVDCGALPESLVESELFGYEKGAFTGADRRKLGYFELASGGTLFLDEVANLTTGTQGKLLRVLQERRVQHLGGSAEVPVDVRIVVASNRDLETAVKTGQFREDLYHRLDEFTVMVPPLRDRLDDLPVLAETFREEANRELGKAVRGFAPGVLELLRSHAWPGNIRELRNTVKRGVLLSEELVQAEHVEITLRLRKPLREAGVADAAPPRESSSELKKASRDAAAEVERRMIQEALTRAQHNKSEAARMLGIDRTALYYKMRKYGMTA